MVIFWIFFCLLLGFVHYEALKSGVKEGKTGGISVPIYAGFSIPIIMIVSYFELNWLAILLISPIALVALIAYLIWELTRLEKNKLVATTTLIAFYVVCWITGLLSWDLTGISAYHG